MEESVSFSTSDYEGFEDEVIRLRNCNRPDPKTRADMDWRYKGEKSPFSPAIFWVHAADGTRVGMAGLIFRSYWVNNYQYYFAVIGDISLDKEFRGKGISSRLFQFMNLYIESRDIYCSIVIPNYAVQKSLSSVGWKVQGAFVAQVYLIDPTERIYGFLNNRLFANLLGYLFQFFSGLMLWFISSRKLKICLTDRVGESFDSFWQSISKESFIMRDRSAASLRWRYQNHPEKKFSVATFLEGDCFVGYVIYTISEESKICSIYDFVVQREEIIRPVIALFIREIGTKNRVNTVRITLNQDHPYFKALRRMGFFCRRDEVVKEIVYQIYTPLWSSFPSAYTWVLTIGDKDI